MGVYSEMAADLREDVQERTPAVQDAAELAARRADERQQAEEEQAKALLSQMQQNADAAPAIPDPEAEKKAEEDRKRQEHEQAEAKRKAEWEAKQRAKEEAEQAAWENAVAMSDDEVMAASMKRVGDDSERLTRRNMKQCVTEYIQTLCLENVSFARNVMHPRKNMVNCFRWVMFHSRDDFATLSFRENAKATWQCSTLDSLDRIGGFDSKCAFYRQQDEARVARFCKCERGAISVLGYLQRLISRHRELERKWKKQRAIIERMKYVPVLPRDLKGFIHREVMPQYIFYDYQRKGPERAFCTACRHEVSIAAAKHNASGTCPRCKKKITFKSRGKRGRIFDRATVQVLQKAEGNGLVLRIIKVYRSFADSDIPNHFEIWENARQFITLSSSGQCSVDAYYYHYKAGYDLTPWCNGYRPVFDRWKYNFTADMSGVLYQRNLSDTLKDTPWAYSQLEAFSGIASFSGVATFLSAYIKRPKIEHLIKMKLYRLVSGIIYGGYSYSALQAINFNGENMRAILGIDRPYFPLLRELNPSIDQLHLIRQLLQADHKPSTEQIKWFIASKISNADAAKELLAHMSVHKLQRYVEQQFAPEDEAALKRVDYYKMNTLITDYHDYLCMCKELQYDVKNSFIMCSFEMIPKSRLSMLAPSLSPRTK